MAMALTKPAVEDFLDSITANQLDLAFEQLEVGAVSPLIGRKLRDTNIRSELNVVVVSVKRIDGEIIFNPSGDTGTHVRRFFSADDFSRRSNLDVLNIYDAQKLSDYDVVIHLAAHLDKNPKSADQCFRTNSEGTLNLIRNMQPGS